MAEVNGELPYKRGQAAGRAPSSKSLYLLTGHRVLMNYHGAMVRSRQPEPVQALTLRIPERDYNHLRALAFASQSSINDVVVSAIQQLLDKQGTRAILETILDDAKRLAGSREIPRNPSGRGPRRTDTTLT